MTSTSTAAGDEDQIRAVIADRCDAGTRRRAVRRPLRAADRQVRPPAALQYTGPAARDVQALRAWFASRPGERIDYEIRDLAVTVGGGVALFHSLNHIGGALWFRSTIGLRKIGGQWKVTHEHNSTPFYVDGSDKAALGLQP